MLYEELRGKKWKVKIGIIYMKKVKVFMIIKRKFYFLYQKIFG